MYDFQIAAWQVRCGRHLRDDIHLPLKLEDIGTLHSHYPTT